MHVVWLLGIPFQKNPGLTKDPGGVPLWVPLLTGSSFDGFLFIGGVDIFYDGHACCLLPWHSFPKKSRLDQRPRGRSSLGSSFDGFLF